MEQPMLNTSQVRQFRDEGYVIVDGVAPELMEPLRAATDRVVEKGRRREWPHVRTSQRDRDDIWGVSGLLDPALGEPVFGQYMATSQVIEVARDLLGDRELRLGLTNLLCNPTKSDYAIAWHRDAGDPKDTGAAELEHLLKFQEGVQWNAALHDDACLLVVPGTHRRNMTGGERDVILNDPEGTMPGQMIVDLKPGQAVYYNALMLHRGIYPAGKPRRTLHANLVSMREPVPFRLHYDAVKFMADPGFRQTIPAALHPLLDNWLKFGEQFE